MSYFVYLTDTESVKHMDRFWNNDMKTQNTTENSHQWIGGEYYIQTSLYNVIKDKSFCKIICINITFDEELLKNAKYIIAPGWLTISNEFIKYKHKLFSYRYFEEEHVRFPDARPDGSISNMLRGGISTLNRFAPAFSLIKSQGLGGAFSATGSQLLSGGRNTMVAQKTIFPF